ncbi:unnamed protein product [Ostreobium quekettii]|uniref:SKP1 component dimerisation domain-containing protein n=1 Tax=Ostreobium quekettii TaxID=121088 RepID=A0A8S1JB70_9CHLO|nr:unnamed protein product [Ostreobium quekettii]|eukprot:evm.model.scf_1994.1 EVM.evm.TU.scf_1994.1   scf_1994:13696-14886(-)
MMSAEVARPAVGNGGLAQGRAGEHARSETPPADSVGPPKALSKVVWVRTSAGGVQAIPQEVAFLSPFIQREAIHAGAGWNSRTPVDLPKQLGPESLGQIVEYCEFHRAPGRSDKERKLFDEKFIRMDACRLCQLTSAADALDLRPLVDLASRALARLISGKTPEEIRATFNLPDDLTEEEKLEPVPFGTDEPRIRLLNRLYAKKRRELAERKARKAPGEARDAPAPVVDTRSVDELVSFIESGTGGGANHSKRVSRRRKGSRRERRSREPPALEPSGSGGLDSERNSVETSEMSNTSMDMMSECPARWREAGGGHGGSGGGRRVFEIPDCPVEVLFPEEGFEEGWDDPELESEIAGFARALDSDWGSRLQELTGGRGRDGPPSVLGAAVEFGSMRV